jgi:hypothetical protein
MIRQGRVIRSHFQCLEIQGRRKPQAVPGVVIVSPFGADEPASGEFG